MLLSRSPSSAFCTSEVVGTSPISAPIRASVVAAKGAKPAPSSISTRQHRLLQRAELAEIAFMLLPDLGAQLSGPFAHGAAQPGAAALAQRMVADHLGQLLGAMGQQGEGLGHVVRVKLVVGGQARIHTGHQCIGVVAAKAGKIGDRRAIERCLVVQHQRRQLVAVRTGEDQIQPRARCRLVHRVAGRLQGEHRVQPGLGLQRVLRLVDDEGHVTPGAAADFGQRVGQRGLARGGPSPGRSTRTPPTSIRLKGSAPSTFSRTVASAFRSSASASASSRPGSAARSFHRST